MNLFKRVASWLFGREQQPLATYTIRVARASIMDIRVTNGVAGYLPIIQGMRDYTEWMLFIYEKNSDTEVHITVEAWDCPDCDDRVQIIACKLKDIQ